MNVNMLLTTKPAVKRTVGVTINNTRMFKLTVSEKGRHSDKTLVGFSLSYNCTRLHSLYGTVAAIFARCHIREQAVVVATIVAVAAPCSSVVMFRC